MESRSRRPFECRHSGELPERHEASLKELFWCCIAVIMLMQVEDGRVGRRLQTLAIASKQWEMRYSI